MSDDSNPAAWKTSDCPELLYVDADIIRAFESKYGTNPHWDWPIGMTQTMVNIQLIRTLKNLTTKIEQSGG